MTKKDPVVYLVIPVFNGKEHTMQFLSSLDKVGFLNKKIVIVDDGSSDGTTQAITNNHPDVKVISGDGNLWWSGATNKGVEYALDNNADYILTINNDVTMPIDYLSQLVDFAQKHPKTIVGSVILSKKDKSIWYSGAFLNHKTGDLQHFQGPINNEKGYRESVWLTGMGVLVPAEVFQHVGWYDEKRFPLYFGDADFSMRASEKGWNLLVTSSTILVADTESSWLSRQLANPKISFYYNVLFSVRSNYNLPDRIKFYRRHWPKLWALALGRFYIVFFLPQVFVFTKQLVKKHLFPGAAG